jgi:DNA helicase-2/ATP-dependent DNA helicase PcrA
VLADEFQDLSAAQFGFIRRLVPPGSEGCFLTAIGDPRQSIYGFRGASPEIFEKLSVYPGLSTLELPNNYRSTKTIVQAGEKFLAAPQSRRASRNESGPKVTRATLPSPAREAAYVVSRIQAHLGLMKLGREGAALQDAEFMPGLSLNEVAVLFRLRSQGEALKIALDEEGLPWQISGEEPLTATDHLDFTADKISLLTMHAAKGLEFRLVFVVGAEEGLCPFARPGEEASAAREAEEKRLFYVALTRAKDRLYITRAASRRLYGQPLPGAPSPYWKALPDSLCLDATPKTRTAKPKPLPTLFD